MRQIKNLEMARVDTELIQRKPRRGPLPTVATAASQRGLLRDERKYMKSDVQLSGGF
ncbi:hypothetical protein [Variovorax sp. J31P179]|uniref:hypothetical protein n=1 Tax=Variovorax sp. J31P179 TaxID=3053508 RepID=UPI002575BEE0|nr:hypothetical protein [Variovorax sp. J31P179]